jgi:DNA-3-methyladenine glycosylase I
LKTPAARSVVKRRRCRWAEADPLLATYHDREYGAPRRWSDRGCFELLSLEVFQAGLSWLTVLRKRAAFRRAFHRFDPRRVAAMTASDVRRLLRDHHIIRNRLKIMATIANARQVVVIRRRHGSFQRWLAALDDRDPQQTLQQFRQIFRFMGPEIVNEFLTCMGKRPVRHEPQCWMAGWATTGGRA